MHHQQGMTFRLIFLPLNAFRNSFVRRIVVNPNTAASSGLVIGTGAA
jgi:hypothetical protein